MSDYHGYQMFQHSAQPQPQQQAQPQSAFRFSSNAAAATNMQTQQLQQQQQQQHTRSVHSTPMHSHQQHAQHTHTQQQSQQQQQQPLSLYTASAPFHRGLNMQPLSAPTLQLQAPASSLSAAPSFYAGSTTPSLQQHPSNTAHSQLLYQYLLPLEVHATGKDRCRASMILSVSSSFTSSSGLTARSIQLQCHQESDPYFLYFATVSEQEFPRIKQAQNLNVDFTNLAAEIERQISGVEGARKMGASTASSELQQSHGQELGSPSSSVHNQPFESLYHSSQHQVDMHNSSTLSLATGNGSSGSGSGGSLMVRDDMMSAQFLMHASPSGGADGSAEFKLIYRHNFRMMDILSLSFSRASEAQLKKFMVEGWGAEKSARMAAEAEIQKMRQNAAAMEQALEEARARILTHSMSSDSAASSLKIACEQQVLEDRELHAQSLASLRATHESELSQLSKEWDAKVSALSAKLDSLSGEHQRALADKASLHTKLSTLTVEHEHAVSEVNKMREERTAMRQALNAAEASVSALQSEAHKSSIRLAQLESSVTEKSSVLALLQSSAASEAQKHALVSETLAQSKKDVAHWSAKYSAVCAELARGNEALGKLQAKLKAGKDKQLRQRELQSSLEERLAAGEAALKDAQHKASSALQEKSFAESDRDRLLQELKAAQRAITEAAEHTTQQEKMITYLNEQTNKAQMGKISSFTSALMLQPSNNTAANTNHSTINLGGGLRALDAGLTRPSFHLALATPLPSGNGLGSSSSLEYAHAQQNSSLSPGAAPLTQSHASSVAESKASQHHVHPTPSSAIGSATLSKSTRALLANKENAYNHASMFSPAPAAHNTTSSMQQQQMQMPMQSANNARGAPLTTSRLAHHNTYQQTASALAMHKQHDLSYYAPAAQA